MRIALLILVLSVPACFTSSGVQQSNLRSGAEIGETVSERTKAAQKDDETHVIVASSEDGSDAKAATAEPEEGAPDPGEAARATPGSNRETVTFQIGAGGELLDASGVAVEKVPSPEGETQVELVAGRGLPAEAVTRAIEQLKEAGWNKLALTIEPNPTKDDSGAETVE